MKAKIPEPWWQVLDAIEDLRASGLSTDQIAVVLGRSAVQIERLEILARHVRDELAGAARTAS